MAQCPVGKYDKELSTAIIIVTILNNDGDHVDDDNDCPIMIMIVAPCCTRSLWFLY